MNPRRGRWVRYVAVEGIDGSGKSTVVRSLAAALRRNGWSVATRREPFDATLGALAQAASVRDPWTGGVYFTLDRQLAHAALLHDLATHDVVISDRSFYSTLAYQGSALSAKLARRLARLQRGATSVPDRVVWLDLEPTEALRRLGTRSRSRTPLERLATLRRVARAYRRLARAPRWTVVDASVDRRAVRKAVLERLSPALPPTRGARRAGRTRRRT
jgi:dTMP kinase